MDLNDIDGERSETSDYAAKVQERGIHLRLFLLQSAHTLLDSNFRRLLMVAWFCAARSAAGLGGLRDIIIIICIGVLFRAYCNCAWGQQVVAKRVAVRRREEGRGRGERREKWQLANRLAGSLHDISAAWEVSALEQGALCKPHTTAARQPN